VLSSVERGKSLRPLTNPTQAARPGLLRGEMLLAGRCRRRKIHSKAGNNEAGAKDPVPGRLRPAGDGESARFVFATESYWTKLTCRAADRRWLAAIDA
jgi:hypothetical protein